jgi:pimeloyl-ACP methyl ester carboxylesterase
MSTVISKDGTTIGYGAIGQGPVLIFIDGALNSRAMSLSAPIAKLMAKKFTVYTYDRRGRGESGDTLPWTLDREIEDLEALINAAGGSAYVLGLSSGALLALEATKKLSGKIKKLALYEPPMILDNSRPRLGQPALVEIKKLIAADRRDDAIKFFMKAVNTPAFVIFLMRLMPTWKTVRSYAHTIVYDFEIASPYQAGKPLPKGQWSSAIMPTWVGVGGKSFDWMKNAQKALVATLPNATLHELPGQTHVVQAPAIAPELEAFFNGSNKA